ncbi:hypothetical protein LCGC14_1721620 [marine sediment metagenome]|uniref:Uncharacterized protein n=1 Tax=marine sediment metagenome TaxID=412755 RepID=A0A0F9HC15_9ZZZZ
MQKYCLNHFSICLNFWEKGSEIYIWRTIKGLKQSDINVEQANRRTIEKMVKELKSIILANSKKVTIYTGIRTNNEFGIQYIRKTMSATNFKYLPMTDTGVSYFDIDFENDPDFAEEQLKFLAALSLSYVPPYSNSVKEPHNFVFIAKLFGETMTSGKFIFGFDHRSVYSSDLIHSLKKLPTESSEIHYYKVENLSDFGVFDLKQALNCLEDPLLYL